MLQRKIDDLFHGLSNVYSIADDILIARFDNIGRDNDVALAKVLRICRKANLKFNKDKSLFTCTSIPLLVNLAKWQIQSMKLGCGIIFIVVGIIVLVLSSAPSVNSTLGHMVDASEFISGTYIGILPPLLHIK